MNITKEKKIKLFEHVAFLEDLASKETYDNRNYFEQLEGAYSMLKILGINKEYIKWSIK